MRKYLSKMIKLRKQEGLNAVIAEIKVHSPRHGDMLRGRSVFDILKAYERCDVAGISYITEEKHFRGSFETFREICRNTDLPVLRKDFVTSVDEVERTAEADGSALLLIARVLGDRTAELVDVCHDHGIEALVEVHSRDDASIAIETGARLIGINNRDISRLELDDGSVEVTETIAPLLKTPALKVSESGISSLEHLARALKHADAVLVGTAFMLADDLEGKVREFVRGGGDA
ncbi:indole-3-glycerol phosphate synthase [Geoglobus ahangari]|uniref:Indole-3-glycerol phosphate synthase n=1 Tax=Geoglobus ahangari TaxID=113653 RepID=A0A0F7IGD3_9EURY|nr:indole-3-glycerol phosphate synthase TrpC [Geoglobus ahangari]AKG90938.1 indole-3-glycerol phosphate synthase [Geoglobus ahangari]